ncbi:MAG: DUF2378 family protein [Myxococcaceae bacterium]|nr:DUF2378 family protein [Myxococcaceae bacterium]
MAEKMVYRTTVEALLQRTLKARGALSPQVLEQLARLGVDPAAPKDVPKATWQALLGVSAEVLSPGLPRDAQLHALGRQLLRAWNETLPGKVLFTTLRVIGVRRGLHRMSTNFRSSNSYTTSTAKDLGPNDVEVWISDVNGAPTYIQGLMQAAVELAGGKAVTADITATDGDSATYRIRWG